MYCGIYVINNNRIRILYKTDIHRHNHTKISIPNYKWIIFHNDHHKTFIAFIILYVKNCDQYIVSFGPP